MPYRFQDQVLMNSGGKVVDILPGSYNSLNFRFAGTQTGATAPTQANLGYINVYYRNKLRGRIAFTELGIYNDKKFGAREVTQSAGDGQAFAWNFKLPFAHPNDSENVFFTETKGELRIEWVPETALASRVSATSNLRVTGCLQLGKMKYFYGWGRNDIAMVVGQTTPQHILPFNISSIFFEYQTTIDNLSLLVDKELLVASARPLELLNDDLLRNRIETYSAAAGSYAEIDLVQSKTFWETLNNEVILYLHGTTADTISVFWNYFDYQATAYQVSSSKFETVKDRIIQDKVVTGGTVVSTFEAMK